MREKAPLFAEKKQLCHYVRRQTAREHYSFSTKIEIILTG